MRVYQDEAKLVGSDIGVEPQDTVCQIEQLGDGLGAGKAAAGDDRR